MERWNNTLRQANARYVRKTLSFSKSGFSIMNSLPGYSSFAITCAKHVSFNHYPIIICCISCTLLIKFTLQADLLDQSFPLQQEICELSQEHVERHRHERDRHERQQGRNSQWDQILEVERDSPHVIHVGDDLVEIGGGQKSGTSNALSSIPPARSSHFRSNCFPSLVASAPYAKMPRRRARNNFPENVRRGPLKRMRTQTTEPPMRYKYAANCTPACITWFATNPATIAPNAHRGARRPATSN